MSKNTYHCPCDRTFVKSSTAETTGYRLTDYGPGHECFGCPFVLELTEGWGEARKIVGHECRTQKLDPKSPEESISYQTGAWFNFTNYNTAMIYTLDLPWLMEFIRFYRGLEGASYLPEEEKTPAELEQYYRGAGLSFGRRVYSFGFTKNKKGLAAKTKLFQRFFDDSGIAKDTRGPEEDKEKILKQIETAKTAAQKTSEEEPPVAFTYPTPSETTNLPEIAPATNFQKAPTTCRTIADVTAEIRFYKAQTVQSVIEIGKRLTEAKGMLEHGQWLDWLENQVGLHKRTAQNFMQLAEQFPNTQPVAHLSYTKLLALLAVPEEERDEFLEVSHNVSGEEKTVAEMTKRELEHGQWLDWLENQVGLHKRTAQNFMQLAEQFPNTQPVAHLSYTKLLALLAVPEEERDEFLEVSHNVSGEEKTVAEMTKRELEQVIRERDQALKEQERLKMLADASEKTAEIRQRKLEEKGQELYEIKNEATAEKLRYERELKRLESRPVEVAVQPPSEEELERIREEAREEGRQEMWEQQNASRGPGNSWLEGVLVDKSEEYFQNAVKESTFVLITAAAKKPGRMAQRTLEKGISFLQEQIKELFRQCDLLLIHEQGDREEELDF